MFSELFQGFFPVNHRKAVNTFIPFYALYNLRRCCFNPRVVSFTFTSDILIYYTDV
jgi:hypothetical protein